MTARRQRLRVSRLLWPAARHVAGALLALAALLAGVWAWSGSQASLDWAWQRYAQPRGLQAQGLSGSLREGLRARGLQIPAGDHRLDLEGVVMAWNPMALLDRELHITGLRAARLRVHGPLSEDAAGTPGHGPPASLAWPVGVRVDQLAIDDLGWEQRPALQAGDLDAAYRYDPQEGEHRLTLAGVRIAQGRYQGQATLSDRAPMALQARLQGLAQAQAPGGAPLPLAVQARAEGTLADIGIHLDLQHPHGGPAPAGAPSANLRARVTPWAAPFVSEARARLHHLDLAVLWPQGPATALDGSIEVTPLRAAGWRLQADLRNARSGPWDRQRIPFSRVQGDALWREGMLQVRELHAALGPAGAAGRAQGRGRWEGRGGWRLDLDLEGVRPQALHTALSAGGAGTGSAVQTAITALDGRLRAHAMAGAVRFTMALRAGNAGPVPAGPAGAIATGRVDEAASTAKETADAARASRPVFALHALDARGLWAGGRLELQGRTQGVARLQGRLLRIDAAASATRGSGDAAWQGRIDGLHLGLADPRAPGQDWTLRVQAPVHMARDARARWQVGAGQALLQAPARLGGGPVRVTWDAAHWGGGALHSAGRASGLPQSWLLPAAPGLVTGDLVFDAAWEIHLARALRVSARLTRVRGDITLLAETAEVTPARVTAGVREASLALDSEGETLRLALRWASERAGDVQGQLSTRLARGGRAGWHWPREAALAGRVQARLPRIAAWSALAPPGWRLRGSLAADITIGGTRAAPRLAGPLQAEDLSIRSVVDGIALEQGRLRARLDDRRVVIDDLSWQTAGTAQAGGAEAPVQGTLRARGVAGWGRAAAGRPEGLYAQVDARLDRLRAIARSDRLLVLSGQVSARLDPSQLVLAGDLRVDRARITVPDTPAPRLGDDVTVSNLPPGQSSPWGAPEATGLRAVRLDVHVDLGRDFRVSGRGLETGAQGQLHATGTSIAQPRLVGTVSAVDGRYSAYGQRLALRRGLLRFTGPHDDPALDVLAVRTDLDQPVGVQVTGRARAPVLRLWSEEPATEAEKLAWLVLGRGAAAGGAETVLLEQAALSLLARRAGLGTGGIASALGLDELTLRREGEQGAAITLGKRLGRDLYAAYERSLSGALGTLHIFYDLSARLTLRAQAGDRAGVDLVYALSFDRLGAPAPTIRR